MAGDTLTTLRKKIRRLECKCAYLSALSEMYEMMVHDVMAPSIIDAISKKYPAIAASWEKDT